jgi:hypothetical protein
LAGRLRSSCCVLGKKLYKAKSGQLLCTTPVAGIVWPTLGVCNWLNQIGPSNQKPMAFQFLDLI